MRIATLTPALILTATLASAQATTQLPGCLNGGSSGTVVVRMDVGADLRGALLCLTEVDVTVIRDGRRMSATLDTVRRIERPGEADTIWDGALRGLFWAPMVWIATAGPWRDGHHLLRVAVGSTLVGAGIDAARAPRDTVIFTGTRRRPSLRWTVHF